VVRAEIATQLSADWFSAVDRCQALLDATTSTLREHNEVLLRDTHHFVAHTRSGDRRSRARPLTDRRRPALNGTLPAISSVYGGNTKTTCGL
jgi:hypothetical protein